MQVWINSDGHVFESESVESHDEFVREMTEWAEAEGCTAREVTIDGDKCIELVDNIDGTRFAVAQLGK